MILYYAFGGGLGHLTRANAVLNTLGFDSANFLILTSSNFSDLIFDSENVINISDELYSKPSELKSEIERIVYEQKIESFFVDSFPAGINGELSDLKFNNCKIFYVARLLNWENYENYLKNFGLSFETTYIIEDLPDQQLDFIRRYSNKHQTIQLKYHETANSDIVNSILFQIEKPVWLIVHSGNFMELQELIAYATDLAEIELIAPYYLIISQTTERLELNSGIQLNYYPAADFFPFVERIFTASGYNSMSQTVQFIDKHYFIPFARKFDNQYVRAKNRKLLISSNRFI